MNIVANWHEGKRRHDERVRSKALLSLLKSVFEGKTIILVNARKKQTEVSS